MQHFRSKREIGKKREGGQVQGFEVCALVKTSQSEAMILDVWPMRGLNYLSKCSLLFTLKVSSVSVAGSSIARCSHKPISKTGWVYIIYKSK